MSSHECFILEHRMSRSTCRYVFLFLNSICLGDKCFRWHSVSRLQPGMRIFKTVLNWEKIKMRDKPWPPTWGRCCRHCPRRGWVLPALPLAAPTSQWRGLTCWSLNCTWLTVLAWSKSDKYIYTRVPKTNSPPIREMKTTYHQFVHRLNIKEKIGLISFIQSFSPKSFCTQ